MSHERLVRLTGFEPAVYGLKARFHSAWLQTHYFGFKYFRFCFRFISFFLSSFFFIIAAIGIEPITLRVWTEYSRQLSYAAEPPGGFEPPYTAYKAVVLPLDDKGLRSRERTRTSGLTVNSRLLHRLSYPGIIPDGGLEPHISRLRTGYRCH